MECRSLAGGQRIQDERSRGQCQKVPEPEGLCRQAARSVLETEESGLRTGSGRPREGEVRAPSQICISQCENQSPSRKTAALLRKTGAQRKRRAKAFPRQVDIKSSLLFSFYTIPRTTLTQFSWVFQFKLFINQHKLHHQRSLSLEIGWGWPTRPNHAILTLK